MASFSVGADGKRIKTDILVAGYVRNIGKSCRLLIPDDINKICFKFWLITVCDEWDKKLSSNRVEIDGQIIKSNEDYSFASIYGCLGVSKGSYEWQIKLLSDISWFCIGIIEDNEEIMTKYVHGCEWVVDNGCCINEMGHFYFGATTPKIDKYMDSLKKAGAVVTMTLDMNKHTLSYKVNDKDYGIATDKLNKSKYRLAILFNGGKHVIELSRFKMPLFTKCSIQRLWEIIRWFVYDTLQGLTF